MASRSIRRLIRAFITGSRTPRSQRKKELVACIRPNTVYTLRYTCQYRSGSSFPPCNPHATPFRICLPFFQTKSLAALPAASTPSAHARPLPERQVNGRCQKALQGNDLAPCHRTARLDRQVRQTKPGTLRRIGWGTEMIQILNFHLHMEQITRYNKLTVDQGG